MTHFNDLAPCNYFGDDCSDVLHAVGWLSREMPFLVGDTDPVVYLKLKELLHDPWQPMHSCGSQICELCQFDGALGHANLFIPTGQIIYVCPELIAHSIAAHRYRPPDLFISAVMACPLTRTMEYKRLLLKSGGRRFISGPESR